MSGAGKQTGFKSNKCGGLAFEGRPLFCVENSNKKEQDDDDARLQSSQIKDDPDGVERN